MASRNFNMVASDASLSRYSLCSWEDILCWTRRNCYNSCSFCYDCHRQSDSNLSLAADSLSVSELYSSSTNISLCCFWNSTLYWMVGRICWYSFSYSLILVATRLSVLLCCFFRMFLILCVVFPSISILFLSWCPISNVSLWCVFCSAFSIFCRLSSEFVMCQCMLFWIWFMRYSSS